MIRIGKPYVTTKDNRAMLCAHIEISDDTSAKYIEVSKRLVNCPWLTDVDYPPQVWKQPDGCLYFSVPAEMADGLCTERSNAFVVAFFWYACVTGADITFEAPMSERLYKGLTEMLMPQLIKDDIKPIRLIGPVTSDPVACKNGVISGMSAGVDSLFTLHTYGGDDAPQGMRLTHLSHYQLFYYLFLKRQFSTDIDMIYNGEDAINNHVLLRAQAIAAHNNLPLVHVVSNLDRDFYRGGSIYTAMYRYLACTLSLEHLFSTYISSSSGHDSGQVEVCLFVPTQHYEDILVECCQTETLRYVNSDHVTRTEKLRVIADNPDFQRYASVCFNIREDAKNCGECYGCWKTMIPLDMLGKLHLFGEVFDLPKYYANRRQTFQDLILFSHRPEASSARETVRQLITLAREKEEENEAAKLFLELCSIFRQ